MKKRLFLLCVLALGCDNNSPIVQPETKPSWDHPTNSGHVAEIDKDEFEKWVKENPSCYVVSVTSVANYQGRTTSFIVLYK